ncbi:MAG: YdbL family protein [Gammaproteobacteria bacterium]|nr:YdbL family protein [Gammaproteobacteria bacterium]
MKNIVSVKKITVLFTIGLLLVAQHAFALDLQTAKQKGLVGESPSGYLEAVTSPSAETNALIKSVNDQRRQKYQEIATRNKTSLQAVEQLAGKKAIEKSNPGSYVKLNGSWQKK